MSVIVNFIVQDVKTVTKSWGGINSLYQIFNLLFGIVIFPGKAVVEK